MEETTEIVDVDAEMRNVTAEPTERQIEEISPLTEGSFPDVYPDIFDQGAKVDILGSHLGKLAPDHQPLDNEGMKKLKENGYEFYRKIGAGSYGEVWICKHTDKQTGAVSYLACKRLSLARKTNLRLNLAMFHVKTEHDIFDVLKRNPHPNIVQFNVSTKLYDRKENPSFFFPIVTLMFMELCSGNMAQFVIRYSGYSYFTSEQNFKIRMKGMVTYEEDMRKMFYQILDALNFLHNKQPKVFKNGQSNACITHNDIKPGNILYKVSGSHPTFCQFKLTDFGLSKVFLEGEEPKSFKPLGTKLYNGPETNQLEKIAEENFHRLKGYNLVKGDIHQLGVSMVRLMIGFINGNIERERNYCLLDDVLEMLHNEEDNYLDSEKTRWLTRNFKIRYAFANLLVKMCHPDPDQRITIAQIYEHPWMKGHKYHNGYLEMAMIKDYNRKVNIQAADRISRSYRRKQTRKVGTIIRPNVKTNEE